MPTLFKAKDNFETSLNISISDSATSITLTDDPGIAPSAIVIDPDVPTKREIITYDTNVLGVLSGVNRGQDGTTAQSHDAGATVRFVYTALHNNALVDQINLAVLADANTSFTGNNVFEGTVDFLNNIPTIPTITPVSDDQVVSKGYLDQVLINAGAGDVIGPAASTDNALSRYDGISGKEIQNSPVTLSDTSVMRFTDSTSSIIMEDSNRALDINSNGTTPAQIRGFSPFSPYTLAVSNQNLSNSNSSPLVISNNGSTSYFFKKAISINGLTIYTTGSTSPNGILNGSGGDFCFGGPGGAPYYCQGGTAWEPLGGPASGTPFYSFAVQNTGTLLNSDYNSLAFFGPGSNFLYEGTGFGTFTNWSLSKLNAADSLNNSLIINETGFYEIHVQFAVDGMSVSSTDETPEFILLKNGTDFFKTDIVDTGTADSVDIVHFSHTQILSIANGDSIGFVVDSSDGNVGIRITSSVNGVFTIKKIG